MSYSGSTEQGTGSKILTLRWTIRFVGHSKSKVRYLCRNDQPGLQQTTRLYRHRINLSPLGRSHRTHPSQIHQRRLLRILQPQRNRHALRRRRSNKEMTANGRQSQAGWSGGNGSEGGNSNLGSLNAGGNASSVLAKEKSNARARKSRGRSSEAISMNH